MAAFDASPMECAILGADGTILVMNEAWRKVGDIGSGPRYQVGANYLHMVERLAREGNEIASTAGAVLEAVLDGHAERASMDYPRNRVTDQQWFRMRVERLTPSNGVLVMHDDISEHVARYGTDVFEPDLPEVTLSAESAQRLHAVSLPRTVVIRPV